MMSKNKSTFLYNRQPCIKTLLKFNQIYDPLNRTPWSERLSNWQYVILIKKKEIICKEINSSYDLNKKLINCKISCRWY